MYSKEEQKELFDLSKVFLEKEVSRTDLEQLRRVLVFHEWKYSVEHNPLVSDYEYDLLYKKLEKLEASYPDLITPSSPTQRISDDQNASFESIDHLTPMLSLDNSYNEDDLLDFDKQVKKLTEEEENVLIEYVVEPKFDGGSVALVYENDHLIRAATRGNGKSGDEITANMRSLSSIPLKAHFSSKGIKKVELRGEALIPKELFESINKEREKKGLSVFANPRNAATGGLRTKDPRDTRSRGIEAFIFQLGYAEDENGNDITESIENHYRSINLLGQLGFKIPIHEKKLCSGINEVIKFCKDWEEKRDSYGYEIDGMVVKVNSYELQKKCGYTSHHSRWAMAYKFKAKQATTKLLNVEYQVGKIGSITPVAKLKPVQLAGVTVSSVSLHNEEFITVRDLRINDTVLVERAGDVIPYIVKAMDEIRDGSEQTIEFPRICPINEGKEDVQLVKEEGEAAWRCPSCICGAQDLQKLIFHVSKVAMDIDGFGKSIVERFYDLGWVRNIADIYNLDFDKIEELEGFGEKSAQKLKSSIAKSKKNSLSKILHSLSIHHLGKRASSLIAERIETIFDLEKWDEEQFTDIKDIGPVVAKNVIEYFKQEEHLNMLHRMKEYGVDFSQKEEDKPLVIESDAILANKTILFTGTLEHMGRKDAQNLATQNGAKVISAISKKLNILVVGAKAGSKLKKAQNLGTVEILTEDQFYDLIGHNL